MVPVPVHTIHGQFKEDWCLRVNDSLLKGFSPKNKLQWGLVCDIFFYRVRLCIVYNESPMKIWKCLEILKCWKKKRIFGNCSMPSYTPFKFKLLVRTMHNWHLYLLWAGNNTCTSWWVTLVLSPITYKIGNSAVF